MLISLDILLNLKIHLDLAYAPPFPSWKAHPHLQVPFRHHCPARAVSYNIHGTLLLPSQWRLRHWMSFIHFTSMRYLNVSSVQPRAVLVTSVFLSPSIHVPPRAEIKCGPWWPLTLLSDHSPLASYASELMTLCSSSSIPRKFPFRNYRFLPGMAYLRVTEATPSQVSNQMSPILPFFNYPSLNSHISLSSPLLGLAGHRLYCHLTLSVCWWMSPCLPYPSSTKHNHHKEGHRFIHGSVLHSEQGLSQGGHLVNTCWINEWSMLEVKLNRNSRKISMSAKNGI